MSKRLWIAAACLYAAMGVFTFGHVASLPRVQQYRVTGEWGPATSAANAGDAFFGAMFWPLYWSWELQS